MENADLPVLFKNFIGREEALSKILRYHSYQTMFYRSNVWQHSQRVFWLIKSVCPLVKRCYPDFDSERAEVLALIHDDFEMIIGDIESSFKNKMTPEQAKKTVESEINGALILAKKFPKKIGAFNYGELLKEEIATKTFTAQLVKWCDKLDALGESTHEIFGGNTVFAKAVLPGLESPLEYYENYFNQKTKKLPLLQFLFKLNTAPFCDFLPLDWMAIAFSSKPHSPASLLRNSGSPLYEFWKSTIFKFGNQEGIENLTKQKEFPLTNSLQ